VPPQLASQQPGVNPQQSNPQQTYGAYPGSVPPTGQPNPFSRGSAYGQYPRPQGQYPYTQ